MFHQKTSVLLVSIQQETSIAMEEMATCSAIEIATSVDEEDRTFPDNNQINDRQA
jgi:hypothetical protein